VSGNKVSGNREAIVAVSVDRTGTQPTETYRVRRLTVTGNTIDLGTGRVGIVTYDNHPVFSAAYQNVFRDNHYPVADDAPQFLWNGTTLTLEAWRAVGNS
jgi:hypothetical protein